MKKDIDIKSLYKYIMIFFSGKNKSYYNFDWQTYKKYYYYLTGYSNKDEFWWHYIHLGEPNGFIYFDINNNNDHYFISNNSYTNTNTDTDQKLNEEKEIIQNNEISICPRKTIYYYVDFVCQHINRTGIQVVTIYLAKQLLKCQDEFYIDIIFVKWNNTLSYLEPCNKDEIDFLLNYNEVSDIFPSIKYENYDPIHLNNYRKFSDSIFFCPELTFPIYNDLPSKLKNYLEMYHLKSIYILYDIIPLVLGDYNCIRQGFKSYMAKNLLFANKIITISNFTKIEFIQYCQQNNLYNYNFPSIESIPLPHQYRNKPKIESNTDITSKITILVPGTIEPRKQQLKLLKIFNSFLKNNPTIDIEMIVFGNILKVLEDDVMKEIKKSKEKIKYVGIIDNDTLCEYYKKATFSCFISKYEGFGFPIAESLWHGTPVLTSNFGSMLEIANCGGCYSINSHNELEIYDALDNLIKKPEIILKLKSEINSNKFFTWYDYCKNIYIEILKEFN
jgi:glycosyltransferase involved in cell wall biosynthesis